ncbi:MAG: MurR/RpiR family transcriptional regulator [Actinomycetia bacterium]|nr:MurR/RpiR family transcriptional regulator [Actinomycetes bacterium]MCP4225892.1 MurR/RpiR family transcriptional regulator [Actinomycetes bacterium]MCP5033319.1 MurR/RpiR family transcriptional regulator [Actinomycetes bacterium]
MSYPVTLAERIASASPRLTPTERRIANIILDDSTIVAFGTVADVAARVDASGPSVVRFAAKLGFDGYGALQDEAQRSLSEQLERPADRIRRQLDGDVWSQARATATGSVEAVFESVSAETLDRMGDLVANAPGNVWIIGSEGSAAAVALAGGLKLLRTGVRHLVGSPSSISAELVDATGDDVVVAIDFSRYEAIVVGTSELLVDLGAPLVAITDGALSPVAALATVWCGVDVPATGPFDSALPAVAIAEMLLAHVARVLATDAIARIDKAEDLSSAQRVFFDLES